MFISKKEITTLLETLEALQNNVKMLEEDVKSLKSEVKKQSARNKKYDEALAKRYIHENFANKDEEERKSIIDEWINGAEDNEK